MRPTSKLFRRWATLGVICCAALTAPAQSRVTVEKTPYLNFPNSYRLSNGTVEVIVAGDFGPRILRYGFKGGDNILGEALEGKKETELGVWRPVGGHRLWAAPEAVPATYAPDNDPVETNVEGNSIRLTGPVEKSTGLQKEMTVTLAPDSSEVTIRHRITNRGNAAVDMAPWALTIVNGGGTAIIPAEPYAEHSDTTLLPVRTLALWSYSDLSDPRFGFTRKYMRIKSDPAKNVAIKVGFANTLGWAAYDRKGSIFVKRFPYERGASYPDAGSNTEIYTEGAFMEIETLSPMRKLAPGETAEHVEHWYLFKGSDVGKTDASIDRVLVPLLKQTSPVGGM